jgi:hypothetical protein
VSVPSLDNSSSSISAPLYRVWAIVALRPRRSVLSVWASMTSHGGIILSYIVGAVLFFCAGIASEFFAPDVLEYWSGAVDRFVPSMRLEATLLPASVVVLKYIAVIFVVLCATTFVLPRQWGSSGTRFYAQLRTWGLAQPAIACSILVATLLRLGVALGTFLRPDLTMGPIGRITILHAPLPLLTLEVWYFSLLSGSALSDGTSTGVWKARCGAIGAILLTLLAFRFF